LRVHLRGARAARRLAGVPGAHRGRRERRRPDRRLPPLDPPAHVPGDAQREVPDPPRDQRPRALHARPARRHRHLPRRLPDPDPRPAEPGAARSEPEGAGRRARPGSGRRGDGEMTMGTTESLAYFLPELALSVAILAVIFVDLALTGRADRRASEWPGIVALAGAGVALVLTLGLRPLVRGLLDDPMQAWLFNRMIVLDAFSVFFKVLLGLALLAAVWMSMSSKEVRGQPNEGEYYALLLSSGLAMFLMASAGTLLMAYLSLEFASLTSYVLTGFLRHNRRSGEAALKYLIYGGVASGAMIYGMSWVFGLTGAMDYAGIARGVAALDPASRGALFLALVLVLAGYGLLGFVVFADRGVQALLFYLVVYYLMNLGAFWVVMLIANATGREDLDGYRGLAWRGGAAPALALGVFLFSLAGLPPLAGFVGKFNVFAAGVQAQLYVLVVIGLLNSVISLYYYA